MTIANTRTDEKVHFASVTFKKPLRKTMPQRNSSLLLLLLLLLSPLFLSSAAQFFSKKKGLMVITAFAAAAAVLHLLVIPLALATPCLHTHTYRTLSEFTDNKYFKNRKSQGCWRKGLGKSP